MVRRGALRLPLDATRERPRTTLSDSSLVRSLRSAPWASPNFTGPAGFRSAHSSSRACQALRADGVFWQGRVRVAAAAHAHDVRRMIHHSEGGHSGDG